MRYSPIALLVACTLATSAAHAATNTITFEGEVTDMTCKVSINESEGNATVQLPVVNKSEVIGGKAPGTEFVLKLKECFDTNSSPDSLPKASLKLVKNGISGQGHLSNSADNGAKGVAVALVDADTTLNLKALSNVEVGEIAADGSVSKTFTAKYVAEEPNISGGKMTAVIEYELSYL